MLYAEKIPFKAPTENVEKDMGAYLFRNDVTDEEKLRKVNKIFRTQKLERERDLLLKKEVYKAVFKDDYKDFIIHGIPPPFRQRAYRLLEFLKMNNITWNDKGMLKDRGHVYEKTNIVDLIKHLVIKKHTHVPPGFEHFFKI